MVQKLRGNGEGTIFKRHDRNLWVAEIIVGRDNNGKPVRKTFYRKTRKEAYKALLEASVQKKDSLPVNSSKQTVKDFMIRWVEDCVKMSSALRTYECYAGIIRNHIIPEIGLIKLNKLNAQHLQHLYMKKREVGLTRTVELIHAVTHIALNQAVKWEILPRNVATLVDKPRVPKQEFKVYNPEQATRFLAVAREDRYYALFTIGITCALRKSEILGLKWSDYTPKDRTLQIQRQLQWIKGGFIFTKPKTKQSRRIIIVPVLVAEALEEHRKKQQDEMDAAGPLWKDHGLIFTTNRGTPIRGSNLARRHYNPLLEKASLERIRLNDLRHTAASLLFLKETHPKLVQALLGHSNIRTTLDTYTHFYPAMKEQTAVKMDEIFSEC